jgi:hypothetical protein
MPPIYKFNRKTFRFKRSQFDSAALNNSLRPFQRAYSTWIRVLPSLVKRLVYEDRSGSRLAIVLVSIPLLWDYKGAWQRFFVRLSR